MFILTRIYTLYISVKIFFVNTKFMAKTGRTNENKLYHDKIETIDVRFMIRKYEKESFFEKRGMAVVNLQLINRRFI